MTHPTAFPLVWPATWRRTSASLRKTAKFGRAGVYGNGQALAARGLTMAEARARLQGELDLLGAASPILSTNVELRMDGQPRSGMPEPADTGAAVYFSLRNRPIVLACDRWNSVAGNVAAIAAHINALRGMERWGVGSVEQAFSGYASLPAPAAAENWRAVLGVPHSASLEVAEAAFRDAARRAHPDMPGGDAEAMGRLNRSIAAARREFGR